MEPRVARSIVTWVERWPLKATLLTTVGSALPLMVIPAMALGSLVVARCGRSWLAPVSVAVLAGSLLQGWLVEDLVRGAFRWGAIWAPLALLTVVQARSGSLKLAMQVGVIAAVVAVVLIELAVPDVRAFWEPLLGVALESVRTGADGRALDPALVAALYRYLATGSVVAFSMVFAFLALLLARWLATRGTQPGAFGAEYRSLRYGTFIGVLAAVSFIASGATPAPVPVLVGTTVVLAIAFVFQGIALAHALASRVQGAMFWLWGLYLSLVLVPQFMLITVSAAGFVDNWFDFRRRTKTPPRD